MDLEYLDELLFDMVKPTDETIDLLKAVYNNHYLEGIDSRGYPSIVEAILIHVYRFEHSIDELTRYSYGFYEEQFRYTVEDFPESIPFVYVALGSVEKTLEHIEKYKVDNHNSRFFIKHCNNI